MIMLGMALADIEWKKLFTGKRVYGMVLARMVLLPLVAVFFLRTWGMMSSVPDSRSILLVTLLRQLLRLHLQFRRWHSFTIRMQHMPVRSM